MPHHSQGGHPIGALDIPIQIKAAIITIRLFFGLKYREIKAKTGVGESTSHRIYNKVLDAAGNEDFHNIMATLSPKLNRKGREPKIKNGSKLSHEIRQDILYWEDYKFEDAAMPALRAVGITAARSIIKKVTYKH